MSAVGASFRSSSTVDNTSFYSDPQVDSLLDTLDTTRDAATQATTMRAIDARLFATSPGLPLYPFPAVTAVSKRVTGRDDVAAAPRHPVEYLGVETGCSRQVGVTR